MGAFRFWGGCVAIGAAAAVAAPALAADFHLYLNCAGTLSAGGKSTKVHLDLAMRDNNTTALIQRSNVLPVGERMRYTASQAAYAITYRTPPNISGGIYHDWWYGPIFVWYPDFRRLVTTRLSIDRQTAELEGEMLDVNDNLLGRYKMQCDPKTQDDLPEPKF